MPKETRIAEMAETKEEEKEDTNTPAEEEAADGDDGDGETEKKKKKKAKPKAKNAKSEMGGDGEYSDKTYEEICKKDIHWVDNLVNSRERLSNEEEEFVDWILNKEDGRAIHAKYRARAQSKCMAVSCTIQ